MLKSLQIKDYALIENVNVEFEKGLNIITGETGAGKSILIDAMGLLLGERASTEVVRKGSRKSIVEGIFDVSKNKKVLSLLKEHDVDFYDEMIMRREISLKGANRCFVNDSPVNLNLIKELGFLLVDLHGQHEHQSLLRKETHIEMLDDFAGLGSELEEFRSSAYLLRMKIKEIKSLREKEKSLKEMKELYEFQIREIDEIDPQEGEEEKLENELNILENSEKLLELTTDLFNALYESDNSLTDQLGKVQDKLTDLSGIDTSFKEKIDEVKTALTNINDIADFLRSYKDKIDLESDQLNEVRGRLNSFNLLKKKYGGSIEKIIEHRKKIGDEFETAENFTGKLDALNEELKKLRIECGKLAEQLSRKRKSTSKEIKKGVEESLEYLGISDAKFSVKFERDKNIENSDDFIVSDNEGFRFSSRGFDKVEFYLSTNLGEDLKPLQKVASGGEVSRIMLSLKMILAKNDKLPLLIFDEIDTGVSGRIAQKVGQSLKTLSTYHQIIAITHLPQIASLANHHYFVRKVEKEGRSVTTINRLSDDERIKEVAKLLGGEEITDANLRSAKELMNIN